MAVATEEVVRSTAPKTRRRLWVTVAVVVAALAVIGAMVFATHWPFSAGNIVQTVQQDWPGTVHVGHFERTYFPFPGCILEDVTLNRDGASGAPLVAIQKVTIEANYHDLFLRPGYIYKIILEGLKVSVPAHQPETGQSSQKAQSSQSRSSVRIGEVVTKDALLEVARVSDPPLKFAIHELRLGSVSQNSAFSYRLAMSNPEPPGEIRSNGKLGPWDSAHLDQIPLSGDYTFEHADLGTYGGIAGILSGKGEFHGALGKIETQGTTDIPDFEVTRSHHRVHLKTKFNATVDGTGGDTTLNSVDGTFLHTTVHVQGTVAAKKGQPGKFVAVNLTVRGGRIDDALYLFVREPKAPMQGVADYHAHVTWPNSDTPFVKRVVLQGEFEIHQAQWENAERQNTLNELSKRASGKKKEKDTPAVTGDMKGKVLLSGGVAKFTDSTVTIPGAECTLHGDYELSSQKIDFHGDLKTQASIADESKGAKAVLLKPLSPLFRRKDAGAVIPIVIDGTYADPHFGFALPGK
jgi:hypothetical protein